MPHEAYPILPSKVGSRGKLVVPPDGYIMHYTITDEVRLVQTRFPRKMLCLQRLEFDDDHRVELRLGYYIIGYKPSVAGRWIWGQFSALIPLSDFRTLIRKAEKRGWL
jgi:hypothetical protein